jgi:hypothetical protein
MLIAASCADPLAVPQLAAEASPPQAGLVLPQLAALRESQSSEYRCERQLFRVCWKWQRVLPRCSAGRYHIAPVSYNRDFNQDKNVDLAPGQQLYAKILSSQSWDGACRDYVLKNCCRPVRYIGA